MQAEEGRGWTKTDDRLSELNWLADDQLVREAGVVFCHHSGKNPRCAKMHPHDRCFIPSLVEAAEAILDLHKEANYLHPKNRYILECYIVVDHESLIITD